MTTADRFYANEKHLVHLPAHPYKEDPIIDGVAVKHVFAVTARMQVGRVPEVVFYIHGPGVEFDGEASVSVRDGSALMREAAIMGKLGQAIGLGRYLAGQLLHLKAGDPMVPLSELEPGMWTKELDELEDWMKAQP